MARQDGTDLRRLTDAVGYEEDPSLVRSIIQDGCEKAADLADETMRDVREAMGLDYT